MTNKVGRPSIMTPETIKALEAAFMLGCTDKEAAFAADIAPSTLYNYCEAHPDFLERKEVLKKSPVYLARQVVFKSLQKDDIFTAQRVLDRHDGTKTIQEHTGSINLTSISDDDLQRIATGSRPRTPVA